MIPQYPLKITKLVNFFVQLSNQNHCPQSLIDEPTEIGISGVQLSPKDGVRKLQVFNRLN